MGTGILVCEAIKRLLTEVAPIDGRYDGRLMLCIALVGLLVNLAMMYLLGHEGHAHGGHGHSHGLGHENEQCHNHGDGHSHSGQEQHLRGNGDHASGK